MWIDTHSHLYLPEFDADRKQVFKRAKEAGVTKIILPNIDEDSLPLLKQTVKEYPQQAYPLIGLHPTSVTANWKQDLRFVEDELQNNRYYGIGEIGIDLYWEKTLGKEQKHAFRHQLELAVSYNLPAIIHIREAFDEVFSVIEDYNNPNLFGIFHCFTGSLQQAKRAIGLGFYLGIGGVSTFKNASLPEVVEKLEVEHLVVETDAPYLTPHPYRGKRNESSYIPLIGGKIAEVKQISIAEVARQTTENATTIFGFDDEKEK